MSGIALLLLLQATSPAAATGAEAHRWSILLPPCAAAPDAQDKDIVVCGHPDAITPRLPLPQFRGPPDHPAPSNPDLDASVALNGPSARAECGAYGEGCPVGGGGYAVPAIVNGALDLAHDAFRRHPFKDKGVPIALDDPAPMDSKSKLLP